MRSLVGTPLTPASFDRIRFRSGIRFSLASRPIYTNKVIRLGWTTSAFAWPRFLWRGVESGRRVDPLRPDLDVPDPVQRIRPPFGAM